MKKYILIMGLFSLLLLSCNRPYQPLHDATIKYADLLQMENLSDERTLCRITNPWVPQQTAIQYLLVDKKDSLFTEADLEEYTKQFGAFQLLRTPLKRQALTSSCHAWLLGQLDALGNVAVMCDANYVIDSTMQQRIADGKVLDGGNSMSPNTEVLLSVQCDAIWISPFENSGLYAFQSRFYIPEIYCADYMETSPLARAEWMRFYGRLVGREAEADSLFHLVEMRYDSIASLSDSLSQIPGFQSPMLLCELPYAGTWYIPGGCSTLGLMYQDAGFSYAWSEDSHAGSLSLAPEAVFHKAQQADIWVFKYNDPTNNMTIGQFRKQHPLVSNIKAAQNGQVYGCNTSYSNYFDITPFRPDILLEELSNIAHGHTSTLRFFQLLPEK